MSRNRKEFTLQDYSHDDHSKIAAIRRRWADKNPKDIRLFGELPDWRTIVEDIHYLLDLPNQIERAYQCGFEDGFEDASDRNYDQAYDDGHKDGVLEGRQEAQQTANRVK